MYQQSVKDLSAMLAQQADQTVRYLLPNGKKRGHEWQVGSIKGEVGESLKVCLSGAKVGVWCDFAAGESGDLVDLWAATRSLSLREAISEVRSYLGIPPDKVDAVGKKNWFRPKLVDEGFTSQSYLLQRWLKYEVINAYKVKETDTHIVFPFYRRNELVLVKHLDKVRVEGKKRIRVSKDAEPILFGWQAVPDKGRRLCITEGEIDAMTLAQYDIGMGVVSVPFGGGDKGKQDWIENEFDNLFAYDEIYLCMDNDEEGQKAALYIAERLGIHRCRFVTLPHKDANECLKRTVLRDEILQCFADAHSQDPQELKSMYANLDRALNPPLTPLGYTLPWRNFDGNVLLRPSDLTLWTGINGHGKSQVLGQVILDCMKQGAKVCIASLELTTEYLMERLTCQASALEKPSREFIRAIYEWYRGKGWVFELVGTAKAERLLEVFTYARYRYGIDVFVIDSLMKCGLAEDDYNGQKLFVERLCDFKNEHKVHVHLVAHPRKGEDEKKVPSKIDIKGSGSIADLADNCFSVWRNKPKEDLMQDLLRSGGEPDDTLLSKPDCVLRCDKQRKGRWEGKVHLWFDNKSFQYLNHHKQRPIPFVDFSKPSIHNVVT